MFFGCFDLLFFINIYVFSLNISVFIYYFDEILYFLLNKL